MLALKPSPLSDYLRRLAASEVNPIAGLMRHDAATVHPPCYHHDSSSTCSASNHVRNPGSLEAGALTA